MESDKEQSQTSGVYYVKAKPPLRKSTGVLILLLASHGELNSPDISHMTSCPVTSKAIQPVDRHSILSHSAFKPFLGSETGLLTSGETVSALRRVRHRFATKR
jgi:hypothetical protein